MFRGSLKRWVIPILLIAIAACDSSGQATTATGTDPAGQYRITGQTVSKSRTYAGELEIEQSGAAYSLAWRLDAGHTYGGTAIYVDGVLGGVYWTGARPSRDLGIVVYQINGGELTGTWIPAGAKSNSLGRENLKGSPGLDGRYEVTLGENPGGRGSKYSGHVEIARRGQTYDVRWFLPGPAYIGQGIRIGDVLAVGYSKGTAPGVIAYCMTENGGQGLWSFGDSKSLGEETISRSKEAAARLAASPSDCVGTGT